MRASPRLREAMDQADIFRLVLPQNGLSSHILKSRISDRSPAGFVGILTDPLLRQHSAKMKVKSTFLPKYSDTKMQLWSTVIV